MRAVGRVSVAPWPRWQHLSFCTTSARLSLNPRATFKYKNEMYQNHLAMLEKYKAEVRASGAQQGQAPAAPRPSPRAAAQEGQAPDAPRPSPGGARPAQAPPAEQGRPTPSAPSAPRASEAVEESTGQQQEDSSGAVAFSEHHQAVEEIMKDPEKARAFQQAIKEYQEQFNTVAECEVRNGRELADAGLDTSSFMLVDHVSAVRDWDDVEEVRAKYYGEMCDLVQKLVGASACFVNGHVIRKSEGGKGTFPPFLEVHSDFTDKYKDAIVASLRSGTEQTPTFGILEKLQSEGVTAEDVTNSQLMVVHVWRNVGDRPLRTFPLAVCDGRTVGEDDLICETVSKLERYRLMHTPSHQWYWFPEMSKDEVLLFKGYDCKSKQYAFHSAFKHPDVSDDSAPRFSCELRLMCLIPTTN